MRNGVRPRRGGRNAAADGTLESDFGKHILPRMLAYDLADNLVPNLTDFAEGAYERDVGSVDAYVDAYVDAHFGTVGWLAEFRLADTEWPIHARADSCAGQVIWSGINLGHADE